MFDNNVTVNPEHYSDETYTAVLAVLHSPAPVMALGDGVLELVSEHDRLTSLIVDVGKINVWLTTGFTVFVLPVSLSHAIRADMLARL